MSVTVRWNGQLSQQLRAKMSNAVKRSAVLLHTRAKVLCSKPAVRQTVRSRGRSRTTYTPSSPGESPALRTGFGRSAITWWMVDDLHARVGVRRNGLYMIFLEIGTRHIRRRPWLSRAMQDTAPAIRILLEAAARV
jgi:HK97 gp10 family phage protein